MTHHFHMIDSGAFSLWNLHNSAFNPFAIVKKKQRTGGTRLNYDFYKTKEFWEYVDEYAKFVKKWKDGIDAYITVDAIRNPVISWKVTKYLEQEHGLNPIPVIHFGSDEKWLHKYLNAGYKYIGLGGKVGRRPYEHWANRMWDIICDTPNRLPVCKVHGFALTTHKQMTKYPWYSADSTTWKKMGYFGQVLAPLPKVEGKFSWRQPFMSVFTEENVQEAERKMLQLKDRIEGVSPYTDAPKHYMKFGDTGKKHFREWLQFIDAPFGKSAKSGKILVKGVFNDKQERVAANIKYFLWLQSEMPKWPWPYERKQGTTRKTLYGLMKGYK